MKGIGKGIGMLLVALAVVYGLWWLVTLDASSSHLLLRAWLGLTLLLYSWDWFMEASR